MIQDGDRGHEHGDTKKNENGFDGYTAATGVKQDCDVNKNDCGTPYYNYGRKNANKTVIRKLYDVNYEWPGRETVCDQHYIGGVPMQLKPPAWLRELEKEEDITLKRFITNGILNGFDIIDKDVHVDSYFCKNYRSATEGKAYSFINELLETELGEHKLLKVNSQPYCVHALGAVEKAGDKYRPITDCKRPLYYSINNFMSETVKDFTFETIDDVCAVLCKSDYIATIDLASAYRSVSVTPEHWKYLGLQWQFENEEYFMLDTRLCFGLSCAPFIFSSLSKFIVKCMRRRGYDRIFCYLDDYIVIGSSYTECREKQLVLISLLRELGFFINWGKCTSPNRKCTYLGIEVNSDQMSISLPRAKLEKLYAELKFFVGKRKATKKQLQRLAGILAHCSKVVRGGRVFSRRVIDLLRSLPQKNVRITLSKGFKNDLNWWEKFSKFFNGTALILDKMEYEVVLCSDASLQGYGFVQGQDWVAGFFNSIQVPFDVLQCDLCHWHWANIAVHEEISTNINALEILPILLAANRYAEKWRDKKIIWYTDNAQVVTIVNKGTSKNEFCMEVLRYIFWRSVEFNFHLVCRHIPGSENNLPDYLSRLKGNCMIFNSEMALCCSKAQAAG